MATSIKVVEAGNYINFFVDGSALPIPTYKSDTYVRPVNLDPGTERYAITGPFGQEKEFDLSEIKDENDQVFTVGDWTTFYENKTGFNPASGGSGAIPVTEKGQPNGVATLDGGGKVPLTQIPVSIQGGIKVVGFWDADTNIPDLSALTLNQGEAYQVSVKGNTSLNGETNWKVRDIVVWSDALIGNWFKLDNTDDIITVTGTGVDNTDPANPIIDRVIGEGRVKVNGSGGVNPSYLLVANVDQQISYGVAALDFSSAPTNEWPQNIISPTDGDIVDPSNDSFLENPILGQLHTWRIIFDYSGKNNNDVVGCAIILRNPLSGFETKGVAVLPQGRTSDTDQQIILKTIADVASLPPPVGTGQGYDLIFNSNKSISITLNSVTRISEFHNERP